MQIASDIMKIVEKKEEYKKNFNRCLDVLVCPKCGETLEKKMLDDPNFIDFKLTCNNCGFTREKLGSETL